MVGHFETALEFSLVNCGHNDFSFNDVALTDADGVIPWLHIPNGKLRGDALRVQKGFPYIVRAMSSWTGTVYACGESEQRLLKALKDGTLRVKLSSGRDR